MTDNRSTNVILGSTPFSKGMYKAGFIVGGLISERACTKIYTIFAVYKQSAWWVHGWRMKRKTKEGSFDRTCTTVYMKVEWMGE